jgi:hypothetical protein
MSHLPTNSLDCQQTEKVVNGTYVCFGMAGLLFRLITKLKTVFQMEYPARSDAFLEFQAEAEVRFR